MAMVECPRCGAMVSDKAKKCVHCGEVLIPEEKKYCMECGEELIEGMSECPNCGCPVEEQLNAQLNEKPQKVEVTGVKVTRKIKIIIGIAIAVLILGGVTIFGVTQYQKKKAAKEYAESVKTYSDNLELATVTMLKGAGDAEDCGNLIKKVWYNAIYKEKDDETDKYTRPDGYFVSDFNDALGNLFVDSSFSSKIDSIDKNQDTVNSLMKKLKNPPKEYKDAYDALSDFYDAYLALTGCATDPSGSLQTYSSTFNDADTDTLNSYKAIYWLFDSGKQNGFKALIYMHRYDADTVGRVRTDYLHRAQKYVETAMQSAQYTIDNATSASEKSKATKAVARYTKQLAEMKIYDEAIAHVANQRIEIDLDDGVKVNYAKFQGVEVSQEGKKALKVDLLAKI